MSRAIKNMFPRRVFETLICRIERLIAGHVFVRSLICRVEMLFADRVFVRPLICRVGKLFLASC